MLSFDFNKEHSREREQVEWKMLSTVCSFKNGFAFKSSLFKQEGEPILRITNIHDGIVDEKGSVYFNKNDYKEDLSLFEIKQGDIVVAMSGATTGKMGCNYIDKVFYLNQRVGKIEPNEEKLNTRYLFH
ncbi:MAG: restriction endonuclease subunit S [Mycoplasmoidaceae bacterium]|nr:restriction endonuclease subunit S [Mycoplasmoidaceae bacterium]